MNREQGRERGEKTRAQEWIYFEKEVINEKYVRTIAQLRRLADRLVTYVERRKERRICTKKKTHDKYVKRLNERQREQKPSKC